MYTNRVPINSHFVIESGESITKNIENLTEVINQTLKHMKKHRGYGRIFINDSNVSKDVSNAVISNSLKILDRYRIYNYASMNGYGYAIEPLQYKSFVNRKLNSFL